MLRSPPHRFALHQHSNRQRERRDGWDAADVTAPSKCCITSCISVAASLRSLMISTHLESNTWRSDNSYPEMNTFIPAAACTQPRCYSHTVNKDDLEAWSPNTADKNTHLLSINLSQITPRAPRSPRICIQHFYFENSSQTSF